MTLLLSALLCLSPAHAEDLGIQQAVVAVNAAPAPTEAVPADADRPFSKRDWQAGDGAVDIDAAAFDKQLAAHRKKLAKFPADAPWRRGPRMPEKADMYDVQVYQARDLAPLLDAADPSFKPANKEQAQHIKKYPYGDDHWAQQEWRSNYQVHTDGSETRIHFWTKQVIEERGTWQTEQEWIVTMRDGVVTEAFSSGTESGYGTETIERLFDFSYTGDTLTSIAVREYYTGDSVAREGDSPNRATSVVYSGV